FAARLWWMLRWIGHASVAVLDGGWSAWSDLGHPTAPGVTDWASAAAYPVAPNPSMTVDAAAVSAARTDPAVALLDARAAGRYRGENETTDPVAGHIPGAVSLPFSDNLDDNKRLRPTAALRERFNAALSDRDPAKAIAYCGSGVTACHNIWAMTCAGLAAPRLYPGSWSEWITDPRRPRTP
ncbi:MAG: rhodanese-like domain-containing protein, partial [Myxococcota bacterium]